MKAARLVFLIVALSPVSALGDDTCRTEVQANTLTAEQARNFMEECKQVAIMVCEGRIIDQKISDDAKDSFLKTCMRNEIGR
jgi:hypothetical protein